MVGLVGDRERRPVGQPTFGGGQANLTGGQQAGVELEPAKAPAVANQVGGGTLDVGLDPAVLLLEVLRPQENSPGPDPAIAAGHDARPCRQSPAGASCTPVGPSFASSRVVWLRGTSKNARHCAVPISR